MAIYLDHAATSPVLPEAGKVMLDSLKQYGNPSSAHALGKQAKVLLEEARKTIASAIGAKPEQIIFTSSGTEANNLVLRSFDKLAVSAIEHASVYDTAKTLGAKIISVDNTGKVNFEKIKEILPNVQLVSIMHGNNETGAVQDVKTIAAICKEQEVLLHTDTVQSFAYEKLNVDELGIDFMTLSSHKIGGPKGVGVLYSKEPGKIKPLLTGGGQESGIRSGTENVSAIFGFAKATELNEQRKTEDKVKVKVLKEYLIDQLKTIEAVEINTPEHSLPHIVNASFIGVEADDLLNHLSAKEIYVSKGSACHSAKLEPSHVLDAMGLSKTKSLSAIRFSLGKTNTKQEIDTVITALKEIVASLRQVSYKS